MATKQLKEMSLNDFIQLGKTPKGQAFLRGELEIMDLLSRQIRAALGDPENVAEVDEKFAGRSTRAGSVTPNKEKKQPSGGEAILLDGKTSTVDELIKWYRTTAPYINLRHATRISYETHFKFLSKEIGQEKITELDSAKVSGHYNDWTSHGSKRVPVSNQSLGMLRLVASFGATVGDAECARLSFLLKNMELYESVSTRTHTLTGDQVDLICVAAEKLGRPSLGLAQALMFETELSQLDVIGEWVPQSEKDAFSTVLFRKLKWIRGIKWADIDENYVLRHKLSMSGKTVEIPLTKYPRVHRELAAEIHRSGGQRPNRVAVIVNNKTGLPWIAGEFRRWWRKAANQSKLPSDLRSTDVPEKALRSDAMNSAS
ncbi:MAG: hypothetical protein NT023_05655 [Armatimonadetes bacterium]|nr:hypothetical protein [Armatimonadota bacterium]